MLHSFSPAPIFTQFYNDPLPVIGVALLEKWNRDYVLRLLISLKLATQHSSTTEAHELITKLLNFLPNDKPSKYGPVDRSILTNKTVILKIICDLLAIPANKNIDTDLGNAFYQDVLVTILIYNEHQFQNTGIGKVKQNLAHADIWKIGFMQNLNAENEGTYRRIGGIKQLLYLQFLKSEFGDAYEEFEKGVVEYTGFPSMQDIILLFVNLVVEYDRVVKRSVPLVVIGPTDNSYSLLHKLELVVDASSGSIRAEVPQLVTAPFLKLMDNKIYLLGTSDFDLITTKSWDFYLVKNKLFQKVLPKVGDIHALKGEWGKKYYESFLGLKILKSLEKNGIRVLESDDKNLPDATIIVNEKDVYVIEMKSNAMDHKVTSAQDISGFRRFIDDKFATGSKGVPQLNRNIEFLSKNADTAYGLKKPTKKLRVFPVIIYTEPHLTKQAVNDYINTVAPTISAELANCFHSVEKVTLIPMDFFLDNIGLLQKDRHVLRNLIRKYHLFVSRTKDSYAKTNRHFDYFAAMVSFESWSVGKDGMYREDQMVVFDTLRKIFELK
ncbi:hypothetical protein [Chitinophaga sp. SYP-B3965]|uniref:hypothetical protein n=1 Tax=Chitinophaga sp. SYP-B3965 TaxID=2663120 RepID=UPI0015670902|nr:hypothetical protein [Chitinophaga sp. SYP-B3965]